jgi:glycosyltransferase involved in cell wall biosynthesis
MVVGMIRQHGGNDKKAGCILFLATKIHPLETGAEICNRKIYENLRNNGYYVELVTEGDISRRTIHSPLCWFSYLKLMLALPHGSLIIASSGLEQRLFIPLLCARLIKNHHVIIISYLIYNYKKSWLLRHIYNLINYLFYHQGEVIVANSMCTKSKLRDMGVNGSRIIIINHGVVEIRRMPQVQPEDNGTVKLISVGFLEPRKGYHLLLEALQSLEHPFRLSIVGSTVINPQYYEQLTRKVTELGLDERVTFTGNLPNARVQEELADADIYIHSSLEEGFGISVFEAAALGKAIVAFDLPVFCEFFHSGVDAILVPIGDVAALSGAIRRVISDPALRMRLGGNAAKLPIAQRAWSQYIDEFTQMLIKRGVLAPLR